MSAHRQRGIALLALLAVLVLGTSWFLVTRLTAASADVTAAKRARNAAVLNQAKQALIGYVTAQASKWGANAENRPGKFPCPEAAGNFGDAQQEGKAASNCSLPKVGRFPWRTIGTDKLVDADGEPLWYVLSPGWGYTSGDGPVINSNTQGQLTVDGVANAAVALIIAPGAPIQATAATGCTAWTQTRPNSGTPDLRNYLECENATNPADSVFVTKGPTASTTVFNDQVVAISAAEVLPGIEAAIATRIEKEIKPVLNAVYASTDWGASVSSTHPVYPFAAPAFTSSTDTPSSANYQGVAGKYAGLLPFSYSSGCTPATDARCTTTFHTWSGSVSKTSGSASYTPNACATVTGTYAYQCTGWWYDSTGSQTATFKYDDRISNIANALKTFDLTTYGSFVRYYNYQTGTWTTVTPTATRTFNTDGSFSFLLTYTMPAVNGWGYFEFNSKRPAFSDHALLNKDDSTTGWFVRNEWYRLVYYAVAPGYTGTSAPSCTTSVNCLGVVNVTPTGGQRAILILAGQSLNGSSRPSGTLSDYLEFGNATGAYESQPVRKSLVVDATLKRPFNDRVVVLGSN